MCTAVDLQLTKVACPAIMIPTMFLSQRQTPYLKVCMFSGFVCLFVCFLIDSLEKYVLTMIDSIWLAGWLAFWPYSEPQCWTSFSHHSSIISQTCMVIITLEFYPCILPLYTTVVSLTLYECHRVTI